MKAINLDKFMNFYVHRVAETLRYGPCFVFLLNVKIVIGLQCSWCCVMWRPGNVYPTSRSCRFYFMLIHYDQRIYSGEIRIFLLCFFWMILIIRTLLILIRFWIDCIIEILISLAFITRYCQGHRWDLSSRNSEVWPMFLLWMCSVRLKEFFKISI